MNGALWTFWWYWLELVSKWPFCMFMPGVWFLWSKKKNPFPKRKWKYYYTFYHNFSEKSSKRTNSTNHPIWTPICRNKPSITPKWFNSLDTNSRNSPCVQLPSIQFDLLKYMTDATVSKKHPKETSIYNVRYVAVPYWHWLRLKWYTQNIWGH